jgi:ABC-2 type transport system permease protein
LIGVGGAALVAWLLFKYSIFSMGLPLLAFFVNLIVLGWAIGLAVSGMVLRWGLGAEELAWAAIFLLAPVSGVYYPISVLPSWLQPVAHAVPASHVFEGMRAVLLHHTFSFGLFFTALGLNVLYMIAGVGVYLLAIRDARQHGMLLQMGE